jgi:hypothetical protein
MTADYSGLYIYKWTQPYYWMVGSYIAEIEYCDDDLGADHPHFPCDF